MLSDTTLEEARAKLTLGPVVPDDQELMARYLGQHDGFPALAKSLFQMDAPHVDTSAWPYAHIDWTEAAEVLFRDGQKRHFLEVDGHWFDALAAKPVVG